MASEPLAGKRIVKITERRTKKDWAIASAVIGGGIGLMALDDEISADEMQAFVSGYLEEDAHGRFGEFWTTIRYLFGAYVAT